MRPLLTTRIAWSAVLLALAAAPAIAQLPSADSAAEFKLAATWTPARTSTVAPLRRAIALNLEGASVKQALREIGRLSGIHIAYGDDVLHSEARVSVHADGMTVREALAAVLEGSGLDAFVSLSGKAVLVRAIAVGDSTQIGTVTGRVTDAKTGEPIPGASVVLVGTRWRATTDASGHYRLIDVAGGTYTLTASRIGYAKQSQSVTVAVGQELTVDVALHAAATELEQVVVTGTVTPTERRAIPVPISVITADQIAQKGYQRVDQIFRGDMPGTIAWDQGPYNYYNTVGIRGANQFGTGTAIKIYIDGVELAAPSYIGMIDPASIERIEVLRGPQGSTLYGSAALSGVMQIFTKHGAYDAPHPQVEAKVSEGLIQSRWDNTAQQDYSVAVAGGGRDFSYGLGGGYLHNGDWVAHANSSNSSLYGSVRGTQGPLTAAFSGRFYGKSYGYPSNPAFYQFDPSLSPANDEPTHLKQQTYGLTITYAATARWQHHLTLGYDHSGYDTYLSRPLYTTPADTFVWISTSDQAKTSVAYNTTYDVSLGRAALASLTAGADHWIYLLSSFYASGITRTNNVSAPASVSRSQYNNSGYFSQAQLGLWDAVYVTAGLRAEDNQNVGQSFGLAWAPRVGVAYVRTVGDVTAKARVAYGKAIRPPSPARAQAAVTNSSIRLANPGLAPEQQVGPDGGLELYFGQRGSLEASYYHQTADNLIDIVDLAVSPKYTYQYQNVGKIKNDGWEFQGRLNSGRFSLTGTYSITTSKVQKLSPNYTGAERPGDQMLHTPRHTAGATLSYIRPRTTATLGMTSVGSWTDVDYVTLYGYYYAGQPYRGSRRAYWTKYSGFTKFNLSVSQTLTDRLAVFVRSDNLTNRSVPELNNYFFTAGRTTMIGMRVKP